MYAPGDIVHVKNAKNGIGVYQIISFKAHWEEYPSAEEIGMGIYRVYALDIDRSTLPKTKDGTWSVTPKRYLTMCKKKPELYKLARFRRYNLTTKLSYNIYGKLPFTPDQVIS